MKTEKNYTTQINNYISMMQFLFVQLSDSSSSRDENQFILFYTHALMTSSYQLFHIFIILYNLGTN